MQHASTQFLKVDYRDTPILIAEKPYNSPNSRQRLHILIINCFKIYILFFNLGLVSIYLSVLAAAPSSLLKMLFFLAMLVERPAE